jgi:hypothetical protein
VIKSLVLLFKKLLNSLRLYRWCLKKFAMAWLTSFRASKEFTIFVVSIASFTDTLIYGIVVPVLPFALEEKFGLQGNEVQWWNSILMSSYGAATAIGAGKFCSFVFFYAIHQAHEPRTVAKYELKSLAYLAQSCSGGLAKDVHLVEWFSCPG